MKKALTIFALLISVVATGQSKLTEAGMNAIYDTTGLKWLSNPKNSTLIIGSYPSESNIQFVTFQMLLDYEKACLADTITIVQYEYKSDFLFKQMEDKGYKRISGHFYGTNPFRYEHYFVKEATLKGFIQWYKEKK